ncbi:MAG: Ig-like domain-containing protein [Paludibacteraceae bacterium]|nr:Ig-like domain-containing protein [Paludibacteraceae bacterium]
MMVGCSNNHEVSGELREIYLNKSKISIEVGEEYTLRVGYEPEEAEEFAPAVTWESTKTKVATVDDGVVKAKSEGKTTIIATCGKFTAECEVEVLPEPDPVPVESISFEKTEMDIFLDETYQLTVIYSPVESERTADAVVWSSSDESVVSVDDEGYATAHALGKATITAKCGTHTANCVLTVISKGIIVSPESVSAPAEGGSYTVTVRTPSAWQADYSADWMSISPQAGDNTTEITVNVFASNSSQEKIATVVFRNDVGEATLTVIREGAPAAFSVSPTAKVQFAPGNLQCIPDDNLHYTASKSQWRFAEHQWDYLGKEANEKIAWQMPMTTWIDLFGWATSGLIREDYYQYTYPGQYDNWNPERFGNGTSDINGTDYDWGQFCTISSYPAGTWRTLTGDEWKYLIFERQNADQLYSIATVNNVNGLIILPDNWDSPASVSFTPNATGYTTNSYDSDQWSEFEDRGAAFLPAAGYRVRQSYSAYAMSTTGNVGYYWSASHSTIWDDSSLISEEEKGKMRNERAIVLRFDMRTSGTRVDINEQDRSHGCSVRLVKDIK